MSASVGFIPNQRVRRDGAILARSASTPDAPESWRRLPPAILRQGTGTYEGRAVAQGAALLDVPVHRVSLESLPEQREALVAGALPVGSVEFVRASMHLAGIDEPESLTYPPELDALLGRRVTTMPLDRVRGTRFVKPVTTKLFTGFVWHESRRDDDYDEHDFEQLQVLRALPRDTMLWVTEPVRFQCEWRYYVLDGQVIGAGRYDPDGEDDAPAPSPMVLHEAVAAMSKVADRPVSYAVDLGVLESGDTVLVEVNDAWAIGLYGRALEPKDYLRFLAARWNQIAATAAKPELTRHVTSRRQAPR
jgi:hypothetical protein